MDEISGINHGESLVADYGALYIPSTVCPLCHDLDNEIGDFEYMNICDDCKFLLMEDLDSSEICAMRTRYSSYDSIESILSQQFLQLNGQAREVLFSDGESVSDVSSFMIYGALPSEPTDTISFTTNGGDSDASADGRNSESFFQSSDESDIDIDPMNVGPVLWNSDNEFEGEGGRQWEDFDEGSLMGTSISRSQLHLFDGALAQDTFRFDYPEALNQNFGDHLDAIGFDHFLTRKGSAACAYFVSQLPQRMINENNMACAICKDLFTVGTYVNQLPCLHIYHIYCILPWLSYRNTCPLCRHQLPTEQQFVKTNTQNHQNEAINELEMSDHIAYIAAEPSVVINTDSSNQRYIPRRTLFFITAPVIGLLGISLMLWLGGNPFPKRRCRIRNIIRILNT